MKFKSGIFTLCAILGSCFISSMAQSGGGETVPENARFKPVDMSDMVDLYTGNFSYSLPLMMIPGQNVSFPLNLSYSSGVKADEEASWAGLGWSLTPGAITRTVSNVPDDMDGVHHIFQYDFPDDYTYGGRVLLFSHNGSYNTGTQKWSGEVGFSGPLSSGFDAGVYAGVNQNGNGYLGANLGPARMSYTDGEEMSLDMSGTTISSDGNMTNGLVSIAQNMMGPMTQLATQQAIASAGITAQGMISSAITDGLASWYVWHSSNEGLDDQPSHGILLQDNINDLWTNTPKLDGSITEYFRSMTRPGDSYDRINYTAQSTGRGSMGIAGDAFSVFAQGLNGVMIPSVEPFKSKCELRFLGEQVCDSFSPSNSGKNTRYFKTKKIEYFTINNVSVFKGKIGSFVITKEDGVRYVFAQPVYVKYMQTGPSVPGRLSETITKKPNSGDPEVLKQYFEGDGLEKDGYAISWLLTAILYPDYVPSTTRSNAESATPEGPTSTSANGIKDDLIPDNDCKGNWVKFTYKKYDDFYFTNMVYENTNMSGYEFAGMSIGADGDKYVWVRSAKELYYLYTAETKTHIAVFDVSKNRTDSYESYNSTYNPVGGTNDGNSRFVRLDRVRLFSKRDVQVNGGNVTCTDNNAIMGWTFDYDQSLCKGITNSDNNNDGVLNAQDVSAGVERKGKLTLRKATQLGRGMAASLPPYVFDYYNDFPWQWQQYDRWGYFSRNGTWQNHMVASGPSVDTDAKQFNLKSITFPTGGKIDVDYESKSYLKVGRYDFANITRQGPTTYLHYQDPEGENELNEEICNYLWEPKNRVFGNSKVFTEDYAMSPDDKITIRVWYQYTSEDHEVTDWTVKYKFNGDDDWSFAGNISTIEGRYEAKISYTAKEHDYVIVEGQVENTSVGLRCLDVAVPGYEIKVIVEPKGVDAGSFTTEHPKKGGGPRVSRVKYLNMLGDIFEKKYKYLDWENNNYPSGVASIEPPTQTKDVDDILEQYSDVRQSIASSPFVCHSHVVVENADGSQSRYKFHTPHNAQVELVQEKDIPPLKHLYNQTPYFGGAKVYQLDGSYLGVELEFYNDKVPLVIHDKSSLWGKPLLIKDVSANGSIVRSKSYTYKQSFDRAKDANGNPVLASDRTSYQRSVGLDDGTRDLKENYLAESRGPIFGMKNGTMAYLATKVDNASTFEAELRKNSWLYNLKRVSYWTAGTLSGGQPYVINFPYGKIVSQHLFRYIDGAYLASVTETKDGVSTITENIAFDGRTGQPLVTKVINPAGDDLVTSILPAYKITKYSEMLTLNMLNQIAQVTKYANSESGDNAVSSTINTWNVYDGVWYKKHEFVWNAICDNTGNAPPLPVFNWGYPHQSYSAWICKSINNRYDGCGHVIDFSKRSTNGYLSIASIYGHNNALPIATISNSSYDECGVFTCDYDNDESGYFDLANGWEKGGSTIDLGVEHFGHATVRVINTFGPTKNLSVTGDKEYRFSAWVAPHNNKTKIRMAVEIFDSFGNRLGGAGDSPAALKSGLTNEMWQKIEYKFKPNDLVPAGTTPAKARIWIGNIPNGESGGWITDFSMDDIRFAPSKALVKTTYYEPALQQVVCTVDANGNPSQRITYDGFGRPVQWDEIDERWSRPGDDKTVTKKEYVFMGSGKQVTLSGSVDGIWAYPGTMQIKWIPVTGGGTVKVEYGNSKGWTTIATSEPDDGSYSWPVPNVNITNMQVRLSWSNAPSEHSSCEVFTIRENHVPNAAVNLAINCVFQNGNELASTTTYSWECSTGVDPDGEDDFGHYEVTIGSNTFTTPNNNHIEETNNCINEQLTVIVVDKFGLKSAPMVKNPE